MKRLVVLILGLPLYVAVPIPRLLASELVHAVITVCDQGCRAGRRGEGVGAAVEKGHRVQVETGAVRFAGSLQPA